MHANKVKPLITNDEYAGQLPPPNKLYITTANFVSRHLTFSWSPVAPDCPAIHYNILASNCGSCPTTTNHTTATCTDVPPENIVCTFAIQPVMCGSLVGNKSDPVSVTTTRGEVIIKGWCRSGKWYCFIVYGTSHWNRFSFYPRNGRTNDIFRCGAHKWMPSVHGYKKIKNMSTVRSVIIIVLMWCAHECH